jgi:hypothetical protein
MPLWLVVMLAGTGSFDCGFAPVSRSKILAQDDSVAGVRTND